MVLIGDMLRRDARLLTRKVGVVEGDKNLSYGELNSRVNRLANALSNLGTKKGDRIAFIGNNCHQFVEFYFAAAKAGLVSVPVNARFSAEEAAYIIRNSEAATLIYGDDMEAVVKGIRESVPEITRYISTGKSEASALSYEGLLESASDEEPPIQVSPDDMTMIMYTSGATGAPKGVVATQRNITANTNTMCLELDIVPEDVTALAMPIYHNGGLWPTMSIVYRGGTNILMPRFDLDALLQIIQDRKVTFLNLVPTMLLRLVSHPNLSSYDLDSLRTIMYAGAPIPLEQLKNAMRILGPHRFYNSLGSTESNGNLISMRTSQHALEGPLASKLGSVGIDAMGVQIEIVDDLGNELPRGVVGEIIGKGDNISPGYWKLPKESAETFRNGWLYTGDMGYRDEDGFIFIVDRRKDIIISGGENIASREVEEILYEHPAVYEATVIGVPDKEWGEAVKAIVALRPEFKGNVDEAELIEFCRPRLAGYKRPRSIDFVAELPKNAAGKIDKGSLKRYYKDLYERKGIKAALGDARPG
jgi:acyl-CoA synthetase (AMP-forming)/AMP-acid ligase II